MQKIIFIRHGETKKNTKRTLHSSFDSEKLNKIGLSQIKKTAKAITTYHPITIFTSKEARAIQSAKIIAESLNTPLKKITGLHERNWGKLSGKTWLEIQTILDPLTLDERYHYVPPEGESWKDFEARLTKTLNKIIANSNGKNIVIITHGGAIRALMPYLLNLPKEESFKYDPDNASLTIFTHTPKGFKKITINDTHHLKK